MYRVWDMVFLSGPGRHVLDTARLWRLLGTHTTESPEFEADRGPERPLDLQRPSHIQPFPALARQAGSKICPPAAKVKDSKSSSLGPGPAYRQRRGAGTCQSPG